MTHLAILDSIAVSIEEFLSARAPLEEGCFCLLREGRGVRGSRFLVSDVILPPPDAWEAQERGQLRPSGGWLSAVISEAVRGEAGLLFVHSHPTPSYPPGLSPVDRFTTIALAQTITQVIQNVFAVAIVHPTGWTAALVHDAELRPIERISAVGRTIRSLGVASVSDAAPSCSLDDRQRDALGIVHERLRELQVGVVGVGGLGSPTAEQLVRMGVAGVTLIDKDVLDTPSNVRRVFGSTTGDLRVQPSRRKVDVVGDHLDHLELDVHVRRLDGDVRYEAVFRELLDMDVVLCGTDTHGSRAVLNELPSTYLLPVIDVGVRAGAKRNGHLAALAAEVRVLTPTTPCLWCRRSISSEVIRAENLPPDQRERLLKEGYLQSWTGEPVPSVIALTMLGSGLATCALLALLSEEGTVCPSGFIVDGVLGYAMETQPTEPNPECRCRKQLGKGDALAPPLLGAGEDALSG